MLKILTPIKVKMVDERGLKQYIKGGDIEKMKEGVQHPLKLIDARN